MGFLFASVTLFLAATLAVFAIEVIPNLPVERFLKVSLVVAFLLGTFNRCIDVWVIVREGFVMDAADSAHFASRSVQFILFTYATLKYFRDGPTVPRYERTRRGDRNE